MHQRRISFAAILTTLATACAWFLGNPDANAAQSRNTAEWAKAWQEVIRAVDRGQLLRVASSRAADPLCRDAKKILDSIPLLTGAFAAKQHGEVVRHLADFQRRLLCLNASSIEVLDNLLGAYLSYSTRNNALKQNEALVHSLFAAGLLTFDQTTPPRRSTWQGVLRSSRKEIFDALAKYPEKVGIWTYDMQQGMFTKLSSFDSALQVLDWLQTSPLSEARACFISDLRRDSGSTALACPDEQRTTGARAGFGARKGPSQSRLAAPHAIAEGAIECILSEHDGSGFRDQLRCVSKAYPLDSTAALNALLLSPGQEFAGLPDSACAHGGRGDLAGASSGGGGAGGGGGSAGSGAGTGGAEGGAAQGDVGGASIWSAIKELAGFKFEVETEWGGGGVRGRPHDPQGGPGPCEDKSGAAARVKTTYNCVAKSDGSKLPAGSRSVGPTFARPIESIGRDPRALACFQQGGDTVRNRAEDSRCARVRCMEGEYCSCNQIQLSEQEASSAKRRQIEFCRQVAYCTEGSCPCDNMGGPGPTGTPPSVRTPPR